MIRLTPMLAVAALLLAGCNQEDHTIVAGGPADEPAAEGAEANGPVALPPSIAASKTYRCADNAVVHVDWLSDGKSANIRVAEGGPVHVTAAEDGGPLSAASGHALAGSAADASVRITLPGGSAQSCKA